MISARQIRAARALLGWSQQQLADAAVISKNTLIRLERNAVDSRGSTLRSIQTTLEKAGVEFLPATGRRGEGVCLTAEAQEPSL